MSRKACAEAAAGKVVGKFCKDCTGRRIGCHGTCETYKANVEKFRRVRDEFIAAEKQREMVNDYVYAQKQRKLKGDFRYEKIHEQN